MPETVQVHVDPDRPWTWTRKNILGLLNDRQRKYIEALENIFQIKRADSTVIPYKPEPYQVWFHAHSPLALGLKHAPHRLVEKGRGVGATLMTAMDLLLLAHHTPRIKVPVAGRQSETGDEFIDKSHELIEDCQIEGFFSADPELTRGVRLDNKSELVRIPGGSPHAIRSKRTIAGALDEFAFNPKPRELWRAARGVMSEGGQMNILSTHDGADTYFFEIVDDTREGKTDYELFYFPAHDPVKWAHHRPIHEQVQEGSLTLLAPWLNPGELSKFAREDPAGYEQEYLAQVIDEDRNLLTREVTQAALAEEPIHWEQAYPISLVETAETETQAEYHEFLASRHTRIPYRPQGNTNPVYLGIDFASKQDLAAFSAIDALPNGGYVQRWCLTLSRVPTPIQEVLLRTVVDILRPVMMGIDMTGGGLGLYEYASKIPNTTVVPIHFSSKAGMPDVAARVPIKKALSLTTSRLMNDRKVRLVGKDHPLWDLQQRHMRAIRRADLDAPRKEGEGHADLFWANAIALYLAEVNPDPTPTDDDAPDLSTYY